MLETSLCLRARSTLTEVKKLDNNLLAFSTEHHGAKIFSFDNCNIESNIIHESLNALCGAVAFSPNSEFIAFAVKNYIFILHIASKIVIKKIKTDNEIINMLEFDLESKYIIAASTSGRILQYRYDGSSLLARLYSFGVNEKVHNSSRSLVSSIAFHKNFVTIGGNCGTIFTINLNSRTNKVIIQNKKLRINALSFIDEETIISGDEKGNLYINSLKNSKLLKKIETGFTSIKQIVLMPNPNFILVIGNASYVSLYDIRSFKLIHAKYIKFSDTVKKVIVFDETNLLGVLNNNTIKKIILPDRLELKSLIIHNSLDKAYFLIKKNAMLKDTPEYRELETAYKKIYNFATKALINQNKEKALQLTSIFKYVDEKQEDIELLFKSFEHFNRFRSLYIEKKIPLAYTLSTKFPALQKTFQYTKMEEMWKDVFKNAQRQISLGQPGNAKALFNDYLTVAPKRALIKLVLNHNEEFLSFIKAIETKNFKTIDKLVKENKLLTQIPSYKNIEKEINKALKELDEDINSCDLDSAIDKISKLQSIDSIDTLITEKKNTCKALKILQDAYDKNDFIKCYESIDKYSTLDSTQLGVLLHEHWTKRISKCEDFALKGNIKDIKLTLGELIHLSTRRDQIGDLFRVSFHTKIKILLAKKSYNKAENIIYSYIDIFGLDNEISSIMNLYNNKAKKQLALSQNSRQDRDSWINSSIIMG